MILSRIMGMPSRWLSGILDRVERRLKTPRMILGFRDADGSWRPRTRVSDTVFFNRRDNIQIGDNVFIWHYTILDGTGGLSIGEGTHVGAWVGIFTHSSHVAIRLLGDHFQEVSEADKPAFQIEPTTIGRYVFIAAAAKILPGVRIGDGSLITSGAVVGNNIPEYSIVSGNPARVIGDVRDTDKLYLRDPQIAEWYNEWQSKS